MIAGPSVLDHRDGVAATDPDAPQSTTPAEVAGVARIERVPERRTEDSTQVELLLIGQQLAFEPQESLLPLTAPMLASPPQDDLEEQSVLVPQESLLPLTAPGAALSPQELEQSLLPLTAPGLAVVSFVLTVAHAPRAATRAAAANRLNVFMGVSLSSFVGDPSRDRRVSTIRVARIGPPILEFIPDLLRFRERLGWGRWSEE